MLTVGIRGSDALVPAQIRETLEKGLKLLVRKMPVTPTY